jgi:anthranilate phosphoribosyltransferase
VSVRSAGPRQRPGRTPDYEGFRSTLKLIGTGPRGSRDLTFDEARDALHELLAGEVSPAQAGAFLIAARIKGESPAELAGYAQALRDATIPLSYAGRRPLVACAGAYDGAVEAPHLSLAAAAIAAACGAGVIVHCGPRVAPKYGTTPADVLAALGGPRSPSPAESEAMLARAGMALVDTGRAVAGWSSLLALRDQIGLRGPVHSAEKLICPFGARRFVVGYTHSTYSERLLRALAVLGAERAIAVRGIEGSDVVRPGRPVAHELAGPLELPEQAGASLGRSPCGPTEAALVTERVLDGSCRGPERTAAIVSAAIRLYAAGVVPDPHDGLDLADAAIADGGALATLSALLGAAVRA